MKRILRFLIYIIILSVLNPSLTIGQRFIDGKIINIKREPINYVSVGYLKNKTGSFTDSSGLFRIKNILDDTLIISCLNYKQKHIVLNKTDTFIEIVLEDDIRLLDQVVIKSKPKTNNSVYLGFYSKNDYEYYSFGKELQYATFISNINSINNGYIDEIKFRLNNFRNSKYNLCIRIYDIDTITGLPNEDLLLSGNYLMAHNLRKVNVFSIKKKNIKLPKYGVFISFQWMAKESDKSITAKTPDLLSNKDADRNYTYTNYMGRGWVYSNKPQDVFGNGYFFVPNLSIKVSY